MEIIINGRDLAAVSAATQASIKAASAVEGLVNITAGNFGGRLGKSWIIAASGLDPDSYLARHDSYTLLDAVDGLFKTGPTHTNVMDLRVGLRVL